MLCELTYCSRGVTLVFLNLERGERPSTVKMKGKKIYVMSLSCPLVFFSSSRAQSFIHTYPIIGSHLLKWTPGTGSVLKDQLIEKTRAGYAPHFWLRAIANTFPPQATALPFRPSECRHGFVPPPHFLA